MQPLLLRQIVPRYGPSHLCNHLAEFMVGIFKLRAYMWVAYTRPGGGGGSNMYFAADGIDHHVLIMTITVFPNIGTSVLAFNIHLTYTAVRIDTKRKLLCN